MKFSRTPYFTAVFSDKHPVKMQTSDDLFFLIKHLDKAEKRHFKLQAGLQKGDKDYLKLFDAMDALPWTPSENGAISPYDERLLKKKLGGKISTTQLHVTKNYLYGQILKSLRSLYEEATTEMRLAVLLSEVKILEQKGLYEQVTKKLTTAKSLALKFEKYSALLELLYFETILSARHKTQDVEAEVSILYEAIFKSLELQTLEIRYKSLQNKATALYRNGTWARDAVSKEKLHIFENEPLLHPESRPATFLSKVSFHFIKATLSQVTGDRHQAILHYKDLQAVWTGYPHFKEEYPSNYIIYSSNYLVCCHLVRDYSFFPALLDDLEKVPLRNYDEKAEAFQNIWYLRQLYFMNRQLFDIKGDLPGEAKKLVKEIQNGLVKYAPRIVKSRQLSFYHNTAVMFFALGEYNEAMEWLVKIQQTTKTDQRKDLQLFARLLQLIIFTEKGEHLHIDNAFKAFEYHLKKEDKRHDFEGIVTVNLKQIASRREDRRTGFTKFQEELSAFEPDKIQGYEEISIWVESKLKNTTFLEVLRGRAGA
ncbi:MAG: hypothetical protein ACKV1O_16845 [Saprospiraceae bacterium]